MAERPLRADAARNRQRVLDAARAAFAEGGPGVSLDDIAARAGVGPGTVYRHFPSKEALFAAVAEARVRDVVADARSRADQPDPAAAFDGFLDRLAAEAIAKRDLPEVLTGAGSAEVRAAADELRAALAVLLARAQEVGAIRADVTAAEVSALVGGLVRATLDGPDTAPAGRLLQIVRDGLRPR
ncbi:TetR/AcrR family transcriptional regulator [Pseudonocardia sp. CA-107938]|uniref:TetR/AcrR family transcriptional regulator n=1 Tax=Pseudonocardia sp. CA-107938 TaxID=3240021 RepID=UPI003D949BF3